MDSFIYHRQKKSVNSPHALVSYRAGEKHFHHECGVCTYKDLGKYVFLCGEPLLFSSSDAYDYILKRLQLLISFYKFCQKQNKKIFGYYLNIPFQFESLSSPQIGLQVLQDLDKLHWSVKQIRYRKRVFNYASSKSYVVKEILNHDKFSYKQSVLKLRKLWLSRKNAPEIKSLLSAPGHSDLIGAERWFVLEASGKLIGFISLIPYFDTRKSYYLDSIFYDNSGEFKLVIDTMLFNIYETLREEQVEVLHFGLCPFIIPLPNSFLEQFFSFLGRWGWVYSFRGLFRFKSKYCDSYRKAYILWNKDINLIKQLYLLIRVSFSK